MTWRTISNTSDLKAYEKKLKACNVRIEARLQDGEWEVFKTYVDGKRSHMTFHNKVKESSELRRLIARLKREKALSIKEAEVLNKEYETSLNFTFERAYKEDFIEKWVFRTRTTRNFLVIRYDETVEVDVVVSDKYKLYEESVVESIRKTLGLDDIGDAKFNIYYFRRTSERSDSSKKRYGLVIGRFEMDFEEE